MRAITALAVKDWRVLLRQPAALFFVIAWPILTAVLFGLIFGGSGSGTGKPKVAIVDLDASAESRRFVERVTALDLLEVDVHDEAAARELVRTGKRTAAVIVPKGHGAAAARMFYGDPPKVRVLVDPSRRAERAMVAGYLQQVAGQGMSDRMFDPAAIRDLSARFEANVDAVPEAQRAAIRTLLAATDAVVATGAAPPPGANGGAWTPLEVEIEELTARRRGPRNGFAVTFPQGLLWGIIGCLMTFASAIVRERQQGTLARLRASPLTPWAIVLGKSLACAGTIAVVATILFALAAIGFGVRPSSWPLLVVAVSASALCFTGVMMLVASLGSTEESVSGAGWAVMMPLMMFGGGMIPLFVMPGWMQSVSHFSPVKWATLALEGAVWRDFSMSEMAVPLAILLAVGALCFAIGARAFARSA